MLTRTPSVSQSVFAPGHLGELTKYVPVELVDAVLEETGSVQRRLRALESRVGVYFLLTLGMFPHLGYAKVWSKLVAGLDEVQVPSPSEKALRDLRRRIGSAPLKARCSKSSPAPWPSRRPRASATGAGARSPSTAAARSRCRMLSATNAGWASPRNRHGLTGYPLVRLMTLVETGTRGLLGAAFGPRDCGENYYTRRLLHLLRPDQLVLADRGFDGAKLLAQIAGTGAQFLVRLASHRRLPTHDRQSDGSYLARLQGIRVRVIEADVTITLADGSTLHEGYRLLTTLLDPTLDPAETLIGLYHERWEIESAYYALRHTLMQGRVLRSGDPFGIAQEIWALLTLYQLLRAAMTDAVETQPGTDPDRASFTVALEAARDQLVRASNIDTGDDLLGTIGRTILTHLLPDRRARISARKVKCPLSHYAYAAPEKHRPPSSVRIHSFTIRIHHEHPTTPPFVSRRHPLPVSGPAPAPQPGMIDRALAVLRAHPGRLWNPKELARAADADNVQSFCVLLARWARQGLLAKPQRGIYTLLDDAAEPLPRPPQTPPLPDIEPGFSRFEATMTVLRSAPAYAWAPRELAPALGITNLASFSAQVAMWARTGRIRKSRHGVYTLLTGPADPTTLSESTPLTNPDTA
ncbi:IS4 family transposase [Streptomyces sp. NPDC046876]|uniref:IS4 family transposase n=1 Tax=Streptomyces sp. NPDC046876 TaxID=3155616 RepID=UPI0033F995F5